MAIATSVFWFSKVLECSLGPMIVLYLNMAVSANDLR